MHEDISVQSRVLKRNAKYKPVIPQLVCNSSSPKASRLAEEVVYFVERHLKCRHSNRGDLKEQWSNHKGSHPWGTKHKKGPYQNALKWFLPLLVLPSYWSLILCSIVKAWYTGKPIYPMPFLYTGKLKSQALKFEQPITLIIYYVLIQSGWSH